MKVEKVCILCPYSFPKGMAPSTRIVAYAKGLVQNSVETEVLCFFPKVREDENSNYGVINGTKWRYIQQKRYNVSKLYNWLIERPKVIWKTIMQIKHSNKVKRIDFVLLSFDDPILQLIFIIALKFLGVKSAFIGDEYPKQIRQLKNEIPKFDIALFKISHRLLSCRILMTQTLIDFYNSIVCNRPSYLLGSILDEARFEHKCSSEQKVDQYLCYMGNMMLAKDNVDNIINAFARISESFPNLYLYLYGTPSKEDWGIIKELIEFKNLSQRILFKGRADYDDVPHILSQACILVTSQPNTKRAEGGFPTKMGEYMMSHVPMIITDVGEIKKYVQDEVTAYIVPPCNPDLYADKITYILTHKKESQAVAERAFNEAINSYSSSEVVKGLVKFLSSI